jgi:DNA-binding protein HU-beta
MALTHGIAGGLLKPSRRYHLNKRQLKEDVAERTGLTKAKAGAVVDAFLEAIRTSLVNGDGLSLVGFGSFTTTQRDARMGRNPQTGEQMPIAAAVKVKFTPGNRLKEMANASQPAGKPAKSRK